MHPNEVPEGLLGLDLMALVGLPEAAAREQVEGLGGEWEGIQPGQGVNLDHRPRRVTGVVELGLVVKVLGRG